MLNMRGPAALEEKFGRWNSRAQQPLPLLRLRRPARQHLQAFPLQPRRFEGSTLPGADLLRCLT